MACIGAFCFKNIVFVKVTFLTRIEERVLIHSCASSSLDRSFSISYLFLAVLGLHCCMGFSLAGHGLASHCSGFFCWAAQALEHEGFSSCSSWAQQLWLLGSGAHSQ